MTLRKEIEKSLRTNDTEVEAVEDNVMQDSVLEMVSGDFKEQDVLQLPLVSRRRVSVQTEYPGKPVSRKKYVQDVGAALDGSDIDDEDSEDDLNDGLMSFDNESSAEDEEVEEEDDPSDEEDNTSDEGDDPSEDESVGDQAGLSESMENDEKDEESSPLKMFSSSSNESADIKKGLAVRHQLRIWESLLETRIKLEPGLIAANQLYQREKMADFVAREKSTRSQAVDDTIKALQDLSSSWSKLQEALKITTDVEKNDVDSDDESIKSSEASGNRSDDEVDEDKLDDSAEPPKKKPKTKNLPSLEESYSSFAPFRDAEITKWNEKAKISSGKAAQKDFSAFDQSILTLIESILFDKYRLVRKTQLKRSDYVIYGKTDKEDKTEDEALEETEESGLVVNKTQSKKAQIYDPEIFDDGDFYQKLLRDFISGKSSDGGISKHERKLMELHRLRIKMKRKIDTKATKGRKLRYVVHPKLVNYMAAVPSNSFSAEAESQLLKSLFGQTASVSTC